MLQAADEYFEMSGRRLTYEYVLLAGVNDQPEHARELAQLLRGRPALLNVIPYNPVHGLALPDPRSGCQPPLSRTPGAGWRQRAVPPEEGGSDRCGLRAIASRGRCDVTELPRVATRHGGFPGASRTLESRRDAPVSCPRVGVNSLCMLTAWAAWCAGVSCLE